VVTDAPLLEAADVERTYRLGRARGHEVVEVHALRGVTFRVERGDYVAIVGTSGSGKSTLLNLLGALDRPTAGHVRYEGRDVLDLSDAELAELRNTRIGFVFQSFHLLPRMTALDNVVLPLVYRAGSTRSRRARAIAALESVGLADRMDHRPTELSGGQQQRVAIARALANDPPILAADEPTGNLDSKTADSVFHLFEELVDAHKTIVMVTHDSDIAARVRRALVVSDGEIIEETVHRPRTQRRGV
jgi:putative ABC transport system ATP-binding protein